MINIREQFWAVEVPSMAFGFDVNNYADESELMFMLSMEDIADEPNSEETLITKKLPPGSWQMVCASKEATPEQVKQIIERNGEGWIDYDKDRLHYDIPFPEPVDSFYSLLVSKGCDLKLNYLILKNQ